MAEKFLGISPKAEIDPRAKIGKDVVIFPFVYIEGDVEIGDGCVIFPNVNLLNGTRLGKNTKVHQNTVVGAIPQDFNWKGDDGYTFIGNGTIIRENVVINRSTFPDGKTVVGDKNYIMEGVHISHDARVGNRNVLGYGTKIAGDVEIADGVITSTDVVLNPMVRVGSVSMIGSGSRISKDVPPFIVAGGNPVEYGGVNSFILEKYGLSKEVIRHLGNAYRLVFNGQTAVVDAVHQIEQQVPDGEEVQMVTDFLKATKLGIITKL